MVDSTGHLMSLTLLEFERRFCRVDSTSPFCSGTKDAADSFAVIGVGVVGDPGRGRLRLGGRTLRVGCLGFV